jgi:hypothetical protein
MTKKPSCYGYKPVFKFFNADLDYRFEPVFIVQSPAM